MDENSRALDDYDEVENSTSSDIVQQAADEGKLEPTPSLETPQNIPDESNDNTFLKSSQNEIVDGNEEIVKSLDRHNGTDEGKQESMPSFEWGEDEGDELEHESTTSNVSIPTGFFDDNKSKTHSSEGERLNDAATGKRRSTVLTLKDLLTSNGRGALSEVYMEIRCGKFYKDSLYLDLTGRIVEEHLGRRLDDDDLSPICTFLVKNEKVIYLSLGYNLITERGFSYLARFLSENSTLYTLNLCHNEITSIDESVLRSTAALWKLRCLLLNGNKMGPRGGLIIGRMLRYNESLRHLDIGETEQTVQSVSHVIQSLLKGYNGNITLQKLNLNRLIPAFQRGFVYSSHLCRLLEQLVIHNRTIVEIHLERNEICDWDLELIIPALGCNNVLEMINLTGNRLTSHGLELLCSVLPKTNIQYLMLASNQIGNDGAIALGRIFVKTKILYLDLSMNKIRDTGMKQLLWGLRSQIPPMHTLFIYGNPLTKETMEILYKQMYMGHISPYATDLQFTFDGEIGYAEDRTANKYRNTYYFVHELSAYKRPLHHSCCYMPSIIDRQGKSLGHLPYRSILPPEEDYSENNPSVLASSKFYAYTSFAKTLARLGMPTSNPHG